MMQKNMAYYRFWKWRQRISPNRSAVLHKKLEIRQNDDILVQLRTNPIRICEKMKKSWITLIVEYLEKTQNRKASLSDIEKTFGKIIEENF
jgi:antitoxin component of MazEF toxin-antitoxin module